MTKQELALSNFAQRISTGYLTVDIGDRLSFAKDVLPLTEKLRRIKQLHKLFDFEYGKEDNGDIVTLQRITFLINTYLNNYRLNGTYTVAETEITPVPYKFANIVIIGGGGSGWNYKEFAFYDETKTQVLKHIQGVPTWDVNGGGQEVSFEYVVPNSGGVINV